VGYSPNLAKYGYMNAMTSATTTEIYFLKKHWALPQNASHDTLE
jgi:hypothetical protein